jgi:hypothetical protein
MTMVVQDFYKFKLSFKGKLIENSADAYDVANTIIATANILQEVAQIRYGSETSDSIKINIHAFEKGSLDTTFLIHAADVAKTATGALLPLVPTIYGVGKEVLETFKTYLEIKKALKGEPATDIKALSGNKFQLSVKGNGNVVNFNLDAHDLRVLQSKTIDKNTEKIVQPLMKDDSVIEEIEYSGEEVSMVKIDKEEAPYMNYNESVQNLEKIKYKGVVTKIDTKAFSGYLDMGSKRLPFNYVRDLPQNKFDILVSSLRTRVQIYVIGGVTMNFQSEPQHMTILDVESEVKLF